MSAMADADYLGLVRAVTAAVGGSDDFEATLKLALKLICSWFDWPAGHVWVKDGDGALRSAGIWYVTGARRYHGFPEFRRATEQRHYPPGVGLPGRVLAGRQPDWTRDPNSEVGANRNVTSGASLQPVFALPVCSGREVVGAMEFYAPTPKRLEPKVLDLMSQVGAEIGVAFERQRVHAAEAESAQRIREILDSAGDAFIGMDTTGCITAWNKAAEAMFGWTRDEALGRRVADTIVPPRYRDAHWEGLQRYLATRIPRVLGRVREVSALDNKGREFPIVLTIWSFERGNIASFYAFARDITERKRRELELERQAHYDALTGLPNRSLLLERLEQALARRERLHHGFAVLFVDLDQFKRINDSFGHVAGDQVLVAVAGRLRQAVRPVDTVARISGDEFIIICPNARERDDASAIAERVLARLGSPIHIKDDNVFLTASVGIVFADDHSDPESLLAASDTAMYRAKISGRGQYELFDDRMRLDAASRLRTEGELAVALERRELRVHFQPIVAAADGRIVEVEALLRWQHPERGLLPPDQFIPIAEETGLIVPIGAWVLEEACRRASEWERMEVTGRLLRVSVNLSARQLAQSDLVPMVERVLNRAAMDPARIEFGIEITESVIMRDPVAAAQTLRALKSLGVHLSIDDFGTGHSSLAYLKRFPVDALKVDQSFVWSLADDPVDSAIIRAVTDMAHALQLVVVAEGVETEKQAQALRAIGVDRMQGYLYARPASPEQITDEMRRLA